MMKHLYGTFTSEQIAETKKSLHKNVHWLLVYKDPENNGMFDHIDVDGCFESILLRIAGMNELLGEQPVLVSILSILQSARNANNIEPFCFQTYRKLILDAHSLIDRIKEEDDE